MLAQRDIRGQRGFSKTSVSMFLTLCQELREIFIEEDTESCFGDDSDEAGGIFSKKMPRRSTGIAGGEVGNVNML